MFNYWKKITHWSIVSFCHNVFKSRLLQRRQKASLCGKGLTMHVQLCMHMYHAYTHVCEVSAKDRMPPGKAHLLAVYWIVYPWDHYYVNCRRDITEIILKTANKPNKKHPCMTIEQTLLKLTQLVIVLLCSITTNAFKQFWNSFILFSIIQ